jgi:hypothetical protein
MKCLGEQNFTHFSSNEHMSHELNEFKKRAYFFYFEEVEKRQQQLDA